MTASNSGELFGLGMTFYRPPMGIELTAGLAQAIEGLQVEEGTAWERPEVLTEAGEQLAISECDNRVTVDGLGADDLISLLVTRHNTLHLLSRAAEPEAPYLIEVVGVPVPHFAMGSLLRTICVRPYYDPQRFPDRPMPDGEYGLINGRLHDVHGALARSMRDYGPGPTATNPPQ